MNKLSKKIYLSPPKLIGKELQLINDAIKSNWISPFGPHIDLFEKKIAKYINRNYATALSSGTAALHLALKVLGISRGDSVFCSDLTFVASANAVKYVKAKPIFIDSDLATWNMCSKALEKAFTIYSPKAVIVTDLYGQSANYNDLIEICKKYNTPIIEDSAESLGAEYEGKKCGSFGDISILSFNGNKIITTSSGGMLLSDNETYIKKAKKYSTQSRENELHYEHKEIGYNYRMSNVLAAIGIGQLDCLDMFVNKTRGIFKAYKAKLEKIEGIEFMPEIIQGRSTNWLSVLLLKEKSYNEIIEIINFFAELNIECRPIWKPMHLQPYYNKCDFIYVKKNPVSKYLFDHGLCLPSGCSLTNQEQKQIIEILMSQIKK